MLVSRRREKNRYQFAYDKDIGYILLWYSFEGTMSKTALQFYTKAQKEVP